MEPQSVANGLHQTFAVTQASFSLIPILFFLTFAISVLLFAVTASLFFGLFWIGLALAIFTPVIVVTFSGALLTWIGGTGLYLASRWTYNIAKEALESGSVGPHPQVFQQLVNGRSGNTSPTESSPAGSSPAGTSPVQSSSYPVVTFSSQVNIPEVKVPEVSVPEVKQEEEAGPSTASQAPAHPEPGSDVDALEP
jgi:hypothetical protein